jgi:hypothetical protein
MTTHATTAHLDARAATHVVFQPEMSERLSALGAARVVCAADNLVVGPSRLDAVEHAQARAAWWGSAEDAGDGLVTAGLRWAPPVAVWTTASLLDRLNLFRTCARLRRLRVRPRDVLIVDFGLRPWRGEGSPPRFRCSDWIDAHDDDALLARLSCARPFSPARFDRAVSLWEKYAGPSPLRFACMCARGVPGLPELSSLWSLLAAFFPRQAPGGTLHLSRFDDLLLGVLGGEWRTPAAVFTGASQAGELQDLLCCTGDAFIPRRLDQWASHGATPAVEREAGPKPDREMLASVYRLTPHGARLRAEGLTRLADAPPLPIGGSEAYGPGSPWVVREDGRLVEA